MVKAIELTDIELRLLEGCRKKHAKSQEMLYKHFYGYAMSVSLRYCKSKDEASEVLNDSFMKVFTKVHQYDTKKSFRGWLRRIIINTAIDFYRKNEKHTNHLDVEYADREEDSKGNIIDQMSADEIYTLVQSLPDIYRITFNLYEIEGYSHEEIGEQMGIPAGTSRFNLSRAKQKLRLLLKEHFGKKYEAYIR